MESETPKGAPGSMPAGASLSESPRPLVRSPLRERYASPIASRSARSFRLPVARLFRMNGSRPM